MRTFLESLKIILARFYESQVWRGFAWTWLFISIGMVFYRGYQENYGLTILWIVNMITYAVVVNQIEGRK